MKMKTLLLIMVAITFVFAGAISVDAACGKHGKVVYMYVTNVHATTYAYVYIAVKTTLPTYGYYFLTFNKEAIATLAAAQSTGKSVYMLGNRSTCVTSGTWRYGGVLTSFRIYTNY